jgi:hypothetical protein
MRYAVYRPEGKAMQVVADVYQVQIDHGILFFKDSSLKIIKAFAKGQWNYFERQRP